MRLILIFEKQLLLHVMVARDILSDRFYRTLYQKLFDPDLRRTHKYTMFLNVVYKSMKMDDEPTRVLAYAKRRFISVP